ncbi:acyl homoserine lactone synthase [Enhydrobacter aerosaccus]|uniref:Acyl-homoserine-lactone synthase n=1 Tax=Enhydrobacter aerosaccus TaxID=225324 RepID=A0A1T4JL31_9HYPH|nr:acyl-homoserine-lactone synthase [Enhydrobacter aerosaccus]SJZ30876.1 acyl homoserine lactone synthase [Enhydrobacter aerosaccus]
MMQLISQDHYGEFVEELADMHRLRYRVFKQRLDWDVQVSGDLEVDDFDAFHPIYLLQRGRDGRVQGCVRLLPSTGPTMLRDAFGVLLNGESPPASPSIWESSRFALDLRHDAAAAVSGIARATFELFIGMVEFGLARGLSSIVTVTDLRMERILRRASWPLKRIGVPHAIGTTRAIAGYLEVSRDALARLRREGGLEQPVLWAPVTMATA